MHRCGTSYFNEVNGILSHFFSSFIYVSYSGKIWEKTRKIVFLVPSWANKISLRDAPANQENGGLITQNTVIISLLLGIAFLCVCVRVCVCVCYLNTDGQTNL